MILKALVAHFDGLMTLLLLIGLLINLSHVYITTVSAEFVPSAAHRGHVRRSADTHGPPV
jgi:hypothetical protein